jgi:hypothetical protein
METSSELPSPAVSPRRGRPIATITLESAEIVPMPVEQLDEAVSILASAIKLDWELAAELLHPRDDAVH